ncbi:monovalent cation/H+ antiporter subunit E [Natronomonas amylolytica]|uniref:monovalent cation/H+ antiporter subunit E n=1 Tax=Natronomonas amylolytica TaxID=3108498 RepID=UPI003009812A
MPDATPETDASGAVLVPVGQSVTLRQTVGYAVDVALEADDPRLHFVAPVAWHDIGDVGADVYAETEAFLERVEVWAREDAGDASITIETSLIGTDEYLFSPDDYARVIAGYAADHDLSEVVVDPEYSPGGNLPLLRPMEVDLVRRGLTVQEALVDRQTRRARLTRPGGLMQFGILFVVAFAFYQLLGGFKIASGDSYDLYYELVTGALSAGIVAGALHRISLSERPRVGRLLKQSVRLVLYVPYLLYEIVVANIAITYIILHPKMPIEPRMTRVRAAVGDSVALTTLANSITLTPGTLTVQSDGQDLYVHALFESAREGLFDGALERAVRFAFYGRSSAAIASPRERDDCEILQHPEEEADEAAADDAEEGDS